MSQSQEDEKKETLKVSRPNTLSLTKTVESGKVKQNFQRGRSKTVTVEVKKTRNFARQDSGRMVEVKKQDDPQANRTSASNPRYLTNDEREARLKALKDADGGSQWTMLPESVNKIQDNPVAAVPEQAAVEAKKPESRGGFGAKQVVTAPVLPTDKKPDGAIKKVKKVGDETDESAARDYHKVGKIRLKEGDAHRRGGGKITVSQALEMQEERMRSLASIKRQRAKANKKMMSSEQEKIVREVIIPEVITVQELANRMAVRTVDVIKELMKLGTMATASQSIDADTAEILVESFGHKFKRVSESDVEDKLTQVDDTETDLEPRAPVVTIMGHVDHGKTSLLDAIRKTDVVSGEAGGITQHIGAYQVALESGEKITFLDTPGHEAFTAMRARGAKVTDIVVLVVAADDGIMPQTEEAINHSKAAGVPIIVAINKIDKPDAQPDRVRSMLMNYGLVPEQFGGDVITVEVSAKQGTGLDQLKEAILLQAEVMNLRVNPSRMATGAVIEAKIDKGRGTVATLLVQRGTLRVGDIVVAGASAGRVRALVDDKGRELEEAGPAMPVEVLGLAEPPEAGDEFSVADSDKTARDIIEYRKSKQRKSKVALATKSVDQLFAAAGANAVKEVPLIIKGDVHGSVEAIVGSLAKFEDGEVKAKVLHQAVGAISESDVTLAQATGAMIVGFNVRAAGKAKELAEKTGVALRYYSIIYDLLDDVRKVLSGMLSPELRENLLGYAEIREVFNITKVGKVAGCMVTEGMIKRGAKVRLLRDNVVIHEGTLKTLKRFKDEVKEVKNGFECGMAFENYDDIRKGDFIEAFEMQEISRSVELKKPQSENA